MEATFARQLEGNDLSSKLLESYFSNPKQNPKDPDLR